MIRIVLVAIIPVLILAVTIFKMNSQVNRLIDPKKRTNDII